MQNLQNVKYVLNRIQTKQFYFFDICMIFYPASVFGIHISFSFEYLSPFLHVCVCELLVFVSLQTLWHLHSAFGFIHIIFFLLPLRHLLTISLPLSVCFEMAFSSSIHFSFVLFLSGLQFVFTRNTMHT